LTTRKDRQKSTLAAVFRESTGKMKLITYLLRELDNENCKGEQRRRYQKVLDSLIGNTEEVESPSPKEKEVEEIDPFA